MSHGSLLVRQFVFENRAFWRNPAAAFFTFLFPLMFLFLFPVIFGDGEIQRAGRTISVVNFYVPAIAVFGLISASYTNLAMTLTFAREAGVLKRKRGTPLPPSLYIGARVLHSTAIGALLVTIVIAVGSLFHDVDVPVEVGAFTMTVVVGTAAFSALGIAITGSIPNEDAAPAIVNVTVLPLLFISDVFIPLTDSTPEWLTTVAEIFPVYHFSQAMVASYLGSEGFGSLWNHVGIMAIWGLAAAAIAFRTFSWEPRR